MKKRRYWNGPAAIEAFLAVEWIGGTRVPVDPGAPADETAAVFAAAGVEAVLTDEEHRADAGERALVHVVERQLLVVTGCAVGGQDDEIAQESELLP